MTPGIFILRVSVALIIHAKCLLRDRKPGQLEIILRFMADVFCRIRTLVYYPGARIFLRGNNSRS